MPGTKHRRGWRAACRSANRNVARSALRVRWRAPNTLRLALACFRKAIQSHRRLARLAPSSFDSNVVDRDLLRQKAKERRDQAARLALAKVYGTPSDPRPPDPEPPLPSARVCRAVERELASWRVWFGLGSYLLEQFKTRHPHTPVNLHSIVMLLKVASDLGHLSTGGELRQDDIDPYATAAADLTRVYGDQSPISEAEQK